MLVKKNIIFVLIIVVTACKKPTKNSNFLADQAYLEIKNGKNNKAIEILETALNKNYDSNLAALQGSLLFQEQKFSLAEKIFKKILDSDISESFKTEILNNLACCYAANNKKNDAKQIWLNLLNNNYYSMPEIANFNIGLMEFQNNEYLNAIKYLEKSLERDPEYFDARYYLALSYYYYDRKKCLEQIKILENKFPENFNIQNIKNKLSNI